MAAQISIAIKKQGILDTLQDDGRYGYQHLGIPPGGAMDRLSVRLVNALVGNKAETAALEMHFPAPEIEIVCTQLLALGGADFGAEINGLSIPLFQPLLVTAGSVIRFTKKTAGCRLYLAAQGGWILDNWLGSESTLLLAGKGGLQGRALRKGDYLTRKEASLYEQSGSTKAFEILPWRADIAAWYQAGPFRMIAGAAYSHLTSAAQHKLSGSPFLILPESNRMGYRLAGTALASKKQEILLSAGVTRGSIQLLPDQQLVVLMADHQTTGGYPVVGHICRADLPRLAQLSPGESLVLQLIDQPAAEALYIDHENHLQQLSNACNFRLQEYFS
ncbi:MAG TPA: biotin-dependent carboxyltransferase family protein [Sediminibacterium sp.]|nr:biotin-dependent carboxyltransferase family protein [Sediminibacterium sp.]